MKKIFLINLVTLLSFICIAFSCTEGILQSPINIPKAITFNPNLKYDTVTDINGNIYRTISIGEHTWMAENLRVTKFRNGDVIPYLKNNWQNGENLGFCVYDNIINEDSIAKHGILYGYEAYVDKRNIAPLGWHIATAEEWHEVTDDTLKTYRGADWYTSTENASLSVNNCGLTLLPSGCGRGSDEFYSINEYFLTFVKGGILTIDKQNSFYNYGWGSHYSVLEVEFTNSCFAIRCVKDY